jgi:hypothetical protein
MNAQPVQFLPGQTAVGTCSTCGQRDVTGTVVSTGTNQGVRVRDSAHSHEFRHDDGDGRGNGAVWLEKARRA